MAASPTDLSMLNGTLEVPASQSPGDASEGFLAIPADEFEVNWLETEREGQTQKTMEVLTEGFLSNCLSETLDEALPKWDQKADFSVYDEEDILGGSPILHPSIALAMALGATFEGSLEEYELQYGLMEADPSSAETVQIIQSESESESAGLTTATTKWYSFMKARSVVYNLGPGCYDQCSVCLGSLLCGQAAWRLPCMHLLHEECATKLFRSRRVQPVCPVCRFDARDAQSSDA
jgi:hypothetical protein